LLDDIQQQAIDSDRVGTEEEIAGIEDVALGVREGTSMPDAPQAVHDLQNRSRAHRLDCGERADEGVGVGLAVEMRSGDIREAAIRYVLQAAGDASRSVILHVRNVDDLGELL
jgi:hypothetical protein